MPGANFAKFLNTHILSECSLSLDSNDSNPVTVADILMSNQTASRVLRAVIRRLVKPVDIKNFFTVIQSCKSNKFGIRSIIPNKQHGILTDLADLCIRHPSEEFQRTFLRVNILYIIYINICIISEIACVFKYPNPLFFFRLLCTYNLC